MQIRLAQLLILVSVSSSLFAQEEQGTDALEEYVGKDVAAIHASGDDDEKAKYFAGQVFEVVGVEEEWLRLLGGHRVRPDDFLVLEEARQHFADQVRAEKSAETYLRLGIVLNHLEEFEVALKALDKSIELDVTAAAYRERGLLHFANEDDPSSKEKAKQDIDKAIELDAKDHRALVYRGMLMMGAFEDYDEAVSSLDRALELQPEDSGARRLRGYAKHELGKRADAIKDLKAALKIDDMDAKAHYQLARAYQIGALRTSDFENAIRSMKRFVALKPNDAGGHNQIGYYYERIGNYQEAFNHYHKSVEIEPTALTLINRGLIFEKARQPKLALKDYQEALELDPEYAKGLSVLGSFYRKQGKSEKSLEAFGKLLELEPENGEHYYDRSFVWEGMGDGDRLIEDLTKAIELDQNDARYFNQRAIAFQRRAELDRAVEDFSSALKVNDRFLFGYINRGNIYLRQGKIEKALSDAKKAVALEDRVPAAVELAASSYRANKEFDNALKYYDKALALIPNWTQALIGRARVQAAMGEDEKADEDLKKALEASNNDPQSLNTAAWFMATSRLEHERDGKLALRLAELACDLTGDEDGAILDTLAAAYAEVGNFDEAISWVKQAIESSPPGLEKELKLHLEAFEQGKPWRE